MSADEKRERLARPVGAFFFGGLLGWLLGLSVTPVVSTAVTAGFALVGGIVTVAVAKRKKAAEDDAPPPPRISGVLVAALAVGCIAGGALGIRTRTHRTLEPSLDQRIAELEATGVSEAGARRLVLLERFGPAAQRLVDDERVMSAKLLVDALEQAGFERDAALEIVAGMLSETSSGGQGGSTAGTSSANTSAGVFFHSPEDLSDCRRAANTAFANDEELTRTLGEFDDRNIRSIGARAGLLGLPEEARLRVARAMLSLACEVAKNDGLPEE